MIKFCKSNLNEKAILIVSKSLSFLGSLIFINVYSMLFGATETLVGVAMLTGYAMMRNMDLGFDAGEATAGIFLLFPLIGIMAHISQFNLLLAIPVHFFTVYFLMLLSSLPLAYKTYMPFILCYIFAQSNPVSGQLIFNRMIGLTAGGLLIAMVYYLSHRKKVYKRKFRTLLEEIPKNSTRNHFILRMAVGITVAAELGGILHVAKPMWITIVVMSLTQPFTVDTHMRIRYRLIATISGSVIFMFLFGYLIPPSYSTYVLLFLGFIYSFASEYKVQQIFVTINALGAAMILFGPITSIPLRIILLILSVGVVLLLDKADQHLSNMIGLQHVRSKV